MSSEYLFRESFQELPLQLKENNNNLGKCNFSFPVFGYSEVVRILHWVTFIYRGVFFCGNGKS